jgi:quinol monooxygenase YgiN
MWMRVTHGSFDPAKADDVVKAMQDVNLAIRRRPGYHALQGGADRSGGTLVVVSTWESEEAANFPREALGDAFERVVALDIQLDPPAMYEVVE